MDVPAVPSYVDTTLSKDELSKYDAEKAMTEEALEYCRAMGIPVPQEQVPTGDLIGDAFWEERQVHSSVLCVRGFAYTVPFTLLVPSTKTTLPREKWLALVLEALLPVHEQISKWNPDSQLSRMNQQLGQFFECGPLLRRAFSMSCDVHDLSDGLFDPSIMFLEELWDSSLQHDQRPPACLAVSSALNQRMALRDTLQMDPARPQTHARLLRRIDLDAISKGIGVECVANALAQTPAATSHLFWWGGELTCTGPHPAGRPWRLGIPRVPSLPALFRAWRNNGAAPLPRASATIVPLKGSYQSATSGDYARPRRFAYTGFVDPRTGLCLQASVQSMAHCTIIMSDDSKTQPNLCGLCDALATAAMLHPSPSSAHRWLLSVREKLPTLKAFYVASRHEMLSHKDTVRPIDSFLLLPSLGGLAISAESMTLFNQHQPEAQVAITAEKSIMTVRTARIASITPALVSVLLEDSSKLLKQFTVQGISCSALHQSGHLLVATIATSKPLVLRRELSTSQIATIRYVDADVVLPKCSSLAILENVLSFDVEQESGFGMRVSTARPGHRMEVLFCNKKIGCSVREVSNCGDHWIVYCGIVSEQDGA